MLRWMIWYCSPDTGVKFEPYRSKLSSLLLGHGSTPQYYIFTSEQERNMLFVSNLNAKAGLEPAISDFLSRQLYHCTRAPALASLSNTAIFSPCLCTLFYEGKICVGSMWFLCWGVCFKTEAHSVILIIPRSWGVSHFFLLDSLFRLHLV